MIFIIIHHILSKDTIPYLEESNSVFLPLYYTIDTLVHCAVLAFVLISGYFGIKFKLDRFIDLLFVVCFYSFILSAISIYFYGNGSPKYMVKSFLPFSSGLYWFIAIYLQLYIIAPFANIFLDRMNQDKQFRWFYFAFSFIILYLMSFRGFDATGGKNLLSFLYVYTTGYAIKKFDICNKGVIVDYKYIILFVILLLSLCEGMFYAKYKVETIYSFFFSYNSPLLLLFSVLLFVYFRNLKFKSSFINKVASSSLAIYLIHEHYLMWPKIYGEPFIGYTNLCGVLTFAIVLASICLFIDKIRIVLFKLFGVNKLEYYLCKKISNRYIKE